MFNEFCKRNYCINLKERTDRWENALKEFEKIGVQPIRFDAVDGNTLPQNNKIKPGALGCLTSFTRLLSEIYSDVNHPEVFAIFEDDVVFHPQFNIGFNEVLHDLDNLQIDFKLLYLSANNRHNKALPVSSRLCKLNGSYAAHAIVYKKSFIPFILKQTARMDAAWDVFLYHLQLTYPCYVVQPFLAWQQPGYSNIENNIQNYQFLQHYH